MGQERFESAYQQKAPWDIPGPQPAFVGLEESGAIIGSVLDVGCGTGENALYLASRGHEVWALDFVAVAIERGISKAQERGLSVHLQVGDALKLDQLGRTFDTVIDCGLFHIFTDDERPRYGAGLAKVVRPGGSVHILCFSEQEPPGQGPRRVTQREIRDAFHDGWEVSEIREARFQTADHPIALTFTPGGPKAWLATIRRAES
jgi:cyclopropane fatty-acyl-phospholipid synthase-like methyltransferase